MVIEGLDGVSNMPVGATGNSMYGNLIAGGAGGLVGLLSGAVAARALSGKRKGVKHHKKAKRILRRRGHRGHRKMVKKSYGTSRAYARKGGKSVHYTKHGQPYIILKGGKARFIRKSKNKR